MFCHSKSRVISLQSWYLTSLVTSHFFQVWRDFHRTKFELLRYIHFVCRTIYINGRWFGKPSSLWRSSLGRILFCIYRIAQHPYLFKTERYLKKFRFFGARLRNHIFSRSNVDFRFRLWYDKYVGRPVGCSFFLPLRGLDGKRNDPWLFVLFKNFFFSQGSFLFILII